MNFELFDFENWLLKNNQLLIVPFNYYDYNLPYLHTSILRRRLSISIIQYYTCFLNEVYIHYIYSEKKMTFKGIPTISECVEFRDNA